MSAVNFAKIHKLVVEICCLYKIEETITVMYKDGHDRVNVDQPPLYTAADG